MAKNIFTKVLMFSSFLMLGVNNISFSAKHTKVDKKDILLPSITHFPADLENIILGYLEHDYRIFNVLEGHTSGVHQLLMLDNNRLGSASFDDTVKIWDTNGSKIIQSSSLTNRTIDFWTIEDILRSNYAVRPIPDTVNSRCISESSVTISKTHHACGIYDGLICISTNYSREDIKIKAHAEAVMALALLLNKYLVSGSLDKTVKIWDLNNYKLINVIECPCEVRSLICSSNGDIFAGLENGQILQYKSLANYLK